MTLQQRIELVQHHYPDAACVQGALTGQFLIVSAIHWPTALGWGQSRSRAWKDAARYVEKSMGRPKC